MGAPILLGASKTNIVLVAVLCVAYFSAAAILPEVYTGDGAESLF